MSISWHSHHFPPAPLGHCGEIWASYHIEVPLLYPGYLPAKPNGEGTRHAVSEVLQGTQMAPYALDIDAYIYLMFMGTSLFLLIYLETDWICSFVTHLTNFCPPTGSCSICDIARPIEELGKGHIEFGCTRWVASHPIVTNSLINEIF